MAIEIRWRRGTTAQHATFIGAVSEVTVDTDKKTVVVHDGAQAGGFPLQREDANLNSLSTLGTVADRVAYTTAEDTWAETPLTAFARTLLDDTTAEAARATLGTASGSEVITATIAPATDADVTLTEAQYSADVLIIETGAWLGARNIIVPNESRSWQVFSNSAYAATVKTAAGTGVVVPAGQSRPVTCDGTNVDSPLDAYYDKSDVYNKAEIAVANSAPIKVALNAGGDAPIYACRAWVNFNGTGTVAIRASGNVSSITDNGTGDYTVNFTTAMQDADYAVVASGNWTGLARAAVVGPNDTRSKTTSAQPIVAMQGSTNTLFDPVEVAVNIFR